MTTDSPSACAPSLFVGAVGLTTLSAASLASRRALKRAVLARSAFRSAIYSAMAWAPSVARSDFLNCVSAHLLVGQRLAPLGLPCRVSQVVRRRSAHPKRKDPSQIDEMLQSRGSREDAVQRE